MRTRKDGLLLKLLLLDNMVAIQLLCMTPALAAPAEKTWSCAAALAAVFIGAAVLFYLLSQRLKGFAFKAMKVLPAAVLAAAAALFFMPTRDAVLCGALTLLSELVLRLVNERVNASDVRPSLRIIAELVNACVLSMAVLGLRF